MLSLLGFGAKAGIAPMHVWLPEAHPAAPSHISALLSGAMINAGLYGIIRSCEFVAPLSAAPAWWGWLALFLGLGTALMGILKALAQSNLKRLLAYSSVENMGLMLMGVGAWLIGSHSGNSWIGTLGLAGAMFHMLNHSAFKGLLFLTAGEVLHATGTVRMDLLGGLQQRMPLVGAAFGIGAVSIACFPPFNGFAGEFVLALSLLDGSSLPGVEQQLGLLMALVVLGLVSGLAAATYAKAYGITFLGAPRSRCVEEAHRPRPRDLWPLAIPAFLCVAGGLASGHCFRWLISTVNAPLPDPAAGQQVMLRVADMLGTVSLVGMVLLALVAALWLLRKACIAGRLRREETWGCGYRYGTARVQYTDASFSEPLGRLFGGAMGLKVHQELDGRYFPGKASVAISAPRPSAHGPVHAAVRRRGEALQHVQDPCNTAKIHLYILTSSPRWWRCWPGGCTHERSRLLLFPVCAGPAAGAAAAGHHSPCQGQGGGQARQACAAIVLRHRQGPAQGRGHQPCDHARLHAGPGGGPVHGALRPGPAAPGRHGLAAAFFRRLFAGRLSAGPGPLSDHAGRPGHGLLL